LTNVTGCALTRRTRARTHLRTRTRTHTYTHRAQTRYTPRSVDRVELGEPFLVDDAAEAAARQHGGEAVPGDEEPITCCFIVLGHCLQQDAAPTATHRKRIKAAARAFNE
jgi:hypothetical protein